MSNIIIIDEQDYSEILQRTVALIEEARVSVAHHVSAAVSNTYWEIGKLLYEKKLESKHGSQVVKRLSVDLKQRYPKMGVSPRQLWNMKSFYVRYKDRDEKLLRSVALLPWSQNLLILSKDLSDENTLFYANESRLKGWNRDLLLNAIKLKMHESHQPTLTDNNFAASLPATQAMYANEVFRSGYNLGFLGVTEPILELELEHRLVEKIKLFLLELGKGFAYVGRQMELKMDEETSYFPDLVFYHIPQRRYLIAEIESRKREEGSDDER